MITDKYLVISESFASDYMAKIEHFYNPANAGKIDDFVNNHFEQKLAAASNIYAFDGTDAHITIDGPMSPNGPDLYDIFYGFGGTSYINILNAIDQAKQDVNAESGRLIFHANTPGGTVTMVDDVYQAIAGCGLKTETINNGILASGGMWIGAACDVITASAPTAFTGSIGVIVSTYDMSEMFGKMGIKKVVITNDEASEKAPDISTKEGQAVVREELNAIYSVFKERVVSGRKGKISAEAIDKLKASVKIAADAVEIGLIDGIAGQTKKRGNNPTKRKEMIMTLEQLRADHPEMVDAIEASAKVGMFSAEEVDAQVASAKEAGAVAERDRIAAVKAQLIPGHEALIASLCDDGKSTAADAALAIVAAEKAGQAAALAAITTDTNPPAETPEDTPAITAMKLADYNALAHPDRRAFLKGGGKVID